MNPTGIPVAAPPASQSRSPQQVGIFPKANELHGPSILSTSIATDLHSLTVNSNALLLSSVSDASSTHSRSNDAVRSRSKPWPSPSASASG